MADTEGVNPPSVAPEVALSTLTQAVQELSLAAELEDVQRIVRTAARRLTGADGATFVLRDDGQCFYADEDAIEPLWKGKRFPLEACISGWAMLHREQVVIEDIYADDRIPHDAYRPTFVKSLLMVPIRRLDPLGSIGLYWADHHRATEQEAGLASALADSTAIALEQVRLRELSETDPLTGLANRRVYDRDLHAAIAAGNSVAVILLDLDHFKTYNDTHGHPAGDDALRRVGTAWRDVLDRGLLCRYGGEEFAVLLRGEDAHGATAIAERLRTSMPSGFSTSLGVAAWDGDEGADSLLARADRALYDAKRNGRDRVAVAA